MSQKITHDQKETAIEALREHGTMQYAAKISGVAIRTLNLEMTRSAVFKRRVLEAREEGKLNRGDKSIQFISDVAEGKVEVKMPQLTANLAIANWAVPGFRGESKVSGRIEHDVRVITAVPRPKYDEIEASKIKITVDKPKSVEDVVEGVAVEVKNE